MSSAKCGTSRCRASGLSLGRCESPACSAAISGTLAVRHTCGGANWPAKAPARMAVPTTVLRRPGGAKLRELSLGMWSTWPGSMPRNAQTLSTVPTGSSTMSR